MPPLVVLIAVHSPDMKRTSQPRSYHMGRQLFPYPLLRFLLAPIRPLLHCAIWLMNDKKWL